VTWVSSAVVSRRCGLHGRCSSRCLSRDVVRRAPSFYSTVDFR
jgi:hypothetical protein